LIIIRQNLTLLQIVAKTPIRAKSLYLTFVTNQTLTGSMYKPIMLGLSLLVACNQTAPESVKEKADSFKEVGEVNIEGGQLAAEISAFDPKTDRLFTSNNALGNRVDIIDLKEVASPKSTGYLILQPVTNGRLTINSLDVGEDLLAVAASAADPQSPGKVYIFEASTQKKINEIVVGAMPDMVTFTPDNKYIITANEGEPNQNYDNDPDGSVSIISVEDFSVTNIDFESLISEKEKLIKQGFRIFGPATGFSQDIEPEYIAVSDDSRYAWVSLQENNGIAHFDIKDKKLLKIFPLGYKDFQLSGNEIDVCDNDQISPNQWPIKGLYQPDAIAAFKVKDSTYLISANEGDARYYAGYSETSRISELELDSVAFPEADKVKNCDVIGRLIVTTTMGDKDGDGDFDELFAFGTRSFSIWNGQTGKLLMDSQNQVDKDLIANSSLYDDNRSDDKGTEPEGLVIGYIQETPVVFLALERANAVVSYDLSNPYQPKFLQVLETGIGPEGILLTRPK